MKRSYNPMADQAASACCGDSTTEKESLLDVSDDGFRDMVDFVDLVFGQHRDNLREVPLQLVQLSEDLEARLLTSGVNFLFTTNISLRHSTAEQVIVGLGRHDMPKQTRLHKHSNTDYRPETRSQWKVAYARFRGSSLDQIRQEIIDCTHGAASASVIAAVWAQNPALAYELFVPSWKVCMYALVSRVIVDGIQVDFGVDTEVGCWENHC